MKNNFIFLVTLLLVVGCANVDNDVAETHSTTKYNYKDSELLKMSSILLSNNSNDIKL